MLDWLPALMLFEEHENNWEKYLAALYKAFVADFIDGRPRFRGRKLALKRHPMERGKEATFWHLISDGESEQERTPNFRRCERIRWPKPVIENESRPEIKVWENSRRKERRILLFIEEENYLVVLTKRKKYILFWTAYYVEHEHRKRKLLKEWRAYKKTEGSL